MGHLKQSTAYTRTFFMVSSTDHLAAKTAAAPVVNISKAGAAFGAAAGAVSEITNGWYKVALTNVDTNTLGDLSFHITGTGADDVDFADQVFAKTVDDLMSTFTLPANFSSLSVSAAGLVDILQTAADKVWGSAARSLTDKVGFALSAAGVQAIWDALTAALTTVGSIGKRLADDIDATISSRSTYAGGAVASVTAAVTVGTNNDKTGYALSVAGVAAIWDALLTGITTVGSIGKLIKDNLDATITSVKALLPAALVGGRIDASVGNMQAAVITSAAHAVSAIDAAALATDAVNEIRDAVLTAAVDGTTTLQESIRLANAALGGKSSGHAVGAPVYRDLADTKDRITATCDVDGNRTAVARVLS